MPPRVLVLFLGGTISAGAVADGTTARLHGEALLAGVPGLDACGIELDVRDLQAIPGGSLAFDDVLEVLRTARSSDADGVVVVQGTDTLEETAYLVDLLWDDDRPVVFTGAMRGPTLAGPDGAANLLAAVQTAAERRWRGLGAVLVLNDEIHAARHVAKRHTTSPAAFTSPNAGPLGRMVEGVPVRLTTIARRPALPTPDRLEARVPLIVTTLGDDGVLLRSVEDCDGLVVAGFGAGHVPGRIASRLGGLAERMPVVLASRTGAGSALRRTYWAPGSETDLLEKGLVPAGFLDAYKARLLLTVLVADGFDRPAIAAAFAQHGDMIA